MHEPTDIECSRLLVGVKLYFERQSSKIVQTYMMITLDFEIWFLNRKAYLFSSEYLCTPQICILKSQPPKMMIWKDRPCGSCWSHVGGGSWWDQCLIKEALNRSPTSSSMWGHSEKTMLWIRTRTFIRMWWCWQLDLGLSAFRTMRNQFLLFISQPVCGMFYGSLSGLRHFLLFKYYFRTLRVGSSESS